ncbi:reverse transcriptase domain-containing protein [Tanacetum coccineum]
MFNSTLTGNARVWFNDISTESIDSYDDLKKAFLENYLQQKKCIKDPMELHNIKQRDGESTKDFVRRYKLESRDVKGVLECMRISEFVHGITNPELIKRLHDKIPKTVDEMMRVTTSFLRGEVAASNHERKKSFPPWKQKFKAPPPMTTPVEKQNHTKFCEFYGEVGHNTNECMHLKKQIEEMLKAGKLSHLIKELKQNNGKEQSKAAKKGETSRKDKALAILMVRIGDEEHSASAWMNFVVLLVEGGVITLKSSRLVPLECALVSVSEETLPATKPNVEERVNVAINPEYSKQTLMIGSTLTEEGRNNLCGLLQRNLDIFA